MTEILGKKVGATGYGLMGFTWRPNPIPTEDAIVAMKAALESGCNLWSGAEFYGTPEYNSMTLLNAYFTKYPEDADRVVLSMKGCMDLATHAPDGSPEGVRRSMDNILKQLDGKKRVDLFSCSRRDAKTPLEVTIGVLQKEYIDTGKLGGFALSECSAATVREAAKLTKVHIAEVELSMFSPDILNNDIAKACGENNITIEAYSPIGRGILTGRFKEATDFKNNGVVSVFPRFQEDSFADNLKLTQRVEEIAKNKGCTSAQLALAWVRAQSRRNGLPDVVPLPGATTVSRVQENATAISLTNDELAALDDIVANFKPVGERYPSFVPTNT